MGFFRAIRDLFSGKTVAERIRDLAAEIVRYADRFTNAKDYKSAALARDYAERIAAAKTLSEAQRIYDEFVALIRKYVTVDEKRIGRQGHAQDALFRNEADVDSAQDWSDDS